MVLDEFLPLVGQQFVADCEPAPIELTLVEASPLRANAAADRPPFILIFHTPPETILADGNYRLHCGAWGPDHISIWSTPAPPAGQPGYYYQAVFN